jgi:hypothetical protein
MLSFGSETMTNTEETITIKPKDSLLWWRHEFYTSRWGAWLAKWLELAEKTPWNHKDNPVNMLSRLKAIECDPEVAVRLAFLVVSHKQSTQSVLASENRKQQSIKRKLSQASARLWKAMMALDEITKCNAEDKKTGNYFNRKKAQYQNHILKAVNNLRQAMSLVRLIFIKPTDIDSLRELSKTLKPENHQSLNSVNSMISYELETLLWSHALELPPGHELLTLAAYVKASSGRPNLPLMTEFVGMVYNASQRRAPTSDAIEKTLQRFRKVDSIIPDCIEKSTAERAGSGELKQDLLACFPGQIAARRF